MAVGVSRVGSRVAVRWRGRRGARLVALVAAVLASALGSRGARAEAPPAPSTPPVTDEPPVTKAAPDAAPAGLVHEAVTTGRRGAAVVITVGVQSGLVFDTLILAYRGEGDSDFHAREMTRVSEGTYRAEIPMPGTLGRSVAYYVEARDRDGAPVAGRASAQSPLVIQLAGEPPQSLATPEAVASVAPDEDEETDVPADRRFFAALLVGTGAGWASGYGDTNADTMYRPAAFTLASLGQLAPEVGYWPSSTIMLSVQGRFQAVTGTTDVYADGRVYHAANYAAAGFLKATWLASRPGGARPFFSLAAGYGQIRHVVTFDSLKACGASGQEVCVDTIATGPVAVGPGAGIFVDLGAHLVGVLELDTQLTFPAYSVNLDGNLGVAVRF